MRQHEALRKAYEEIVAENKEDMSPVFMRQGDREMLGTLLHKHWMIISLEEKGDMAQLSVFAITRPLEVSDAQEVKGEEEVVAIDMDLIYLLASWRTEYARKKPGVWNRGKGYRMVETLEVQFQRSEVINAKGVAVQTMKQLISLNKRIMELRRDARLNECWEVDLVSEADYNQPDSLN